MAPWYSVAHTVILDCRPVTLKERSCPARCILLRQKGLKCQSKLHKQVLLSNPSPRPAQNILFRCHMPSWPWGCLTRKVVVLISTAATAVLSAGAGARDCTPETICRWVWSPPEVTHTGGSWSLRNHVGKGEIRCCV